jgi:hypothetical protein
MDELQKALEYARDQGVSDRQLAVVVKVEADRVRFQSVEGVVMTHPDVGDYAFPGSAVDQMKQSGWALKTDEPAEEPTEEPASVADETEEKK